MLQRGSLGWKQTLLCDVSSKGNNTVGALSGLLSQTLSESSRHCDELEQTRDGVRSAVQMKSDGEIGSRRELQSFI